MKMHFEKNNQGMVSIKFIGTGTNAHFLKHKMGWIIF